MDVLTNDRPTYKSEAIVKTAGHVCVEYACINVVLPARPHRYHSYKGATPWSALKVPDIRHTLVLADRWSGPLKGHDVKVGSFL